MTAALPDSEAYQTTYRRDFTGRTLEMTGPPPQLIPAVEKTDGVRKQQRERPRRRVRRATETSSQSGGGFLLPGSSLTVGPAPGTQNTAPPAAECDRQVSEALRIDLPEGEGVDYNQWLISKLPEIVEKCCRQQEPAPQAVEILAQPMQRRIRINVTSKPSRAPPERPDDQQGDSTDELLSEEENIRQVHRSRSPSRPRRRRRSARRSAARSATSLESARRSAEGDVATAELVRRVLKEMFGSRPAAGGGAAIERSARRHDRWRSRSCQTSPRLISGIGDSDSSSSRGEGGVRGMQEDMTEERRENEAGDVTAAMAQTGSLRRSPQCPSPPPPPLVAVKSRSPSPQPRDTSRCILDTLTECNRLLRQMSEFFRRAELNERITQRLEADEQADTRAELPIKGAEREGRITQRRQMGRADDRLCYLNIPPTVGGDVGVRVGGGGGGGGGGTARSDGGFSRGDGPPTDTLRHCSDSELSARVRRYSTVAEQGLTVRSWERRQEPCNSPPPLASSQHTGSGSVSSRSWGSPVLLELHGEDRPYRPLASPPPCEAATHRSAARTEEGPRASSPVETAPETGQICSHRLPPAEIDSTEVLLSYDPWQAIENDFRTLLN